MTQFSLRRGLSIAVTLVAVAIVGGCVVMVVVTQMLRDSAAALAVAVEREQMADDCQRDLLLHARARSPAVRERLAADLERRLSRLEGLAETPEERRAAADALALARDDLRGEQPAETPSSTEDPDESPAYAALERLGAATRVRVESARLDTLRLHQTVNIVAVLTGGTVGVAALVLVVVLRRSVLRPLIALCDCVRTFARGEKQARAPVRGPLEVRQIADSFNALADGLVAQRAAHSTYLAGVAHELRNPIQVLASAVSLAAGERAKSGADPMRLVAIIRRQLPKLERLVTDLLDTTNLEAGRLSLEVAEHDVADIVRSVARMFATAARDHRITVRTPRSAVLARCDGQRIEQVVTNLVSNAIKYSPAGGTVEIEAAQRDDRALITVRDEGIGMDEEEARVAFRPFARADSSRKSVPGHGLGLFLAQRIVEEHGGTIHVRSTPGRGSVFTIDLPTTPALLSEQNDRDQGESGDPGSHGLLAH